MACSEETRDKLSVGLFYAIEAPALNGTEALIKLGANVDARHGDEKRTPLMRAVLRSNVERMRVLLEKNANPNLSDTKGWTALHWAVHRGSIECVTLLLRYKADPNLVNIDGCSPLVLAVEKGFVGGVRLLLRFGANVNIELSRVKLGTYPEIEGLLLEHIAKYNLQGPFKWMPTE